MDNLLKIVHQSISVASRQPRWWLFALLQAAAFSAVGQLSKFRALSSPIGILLILAAVLLGPLTIWLWQKIEAGLKVPPEVKANPNFIAQSFSGTALVLATVLIIILTRLIFPFWPLHTLIFAITASTSGLTLLYLALCGQSLFSAFRLAVDTWNKKISITATAALVLILAHGISFTLARGIFGNREFPVFAHSATIWVLLLALMLAIGYFSAILNCFVVFLFLDTIVRKKDPEAEKAKIVQPIAIGVN